MRNIPGEGQRDPQMVLDLIQRVTGTPINKLAAEVKQQADRLFPRRTTESMFMKLFTEIGELTENPENPEEIADVFIMLLDHAARQNVDLEAAIRKKMEINNNRVWEANELGVFRHVK